MANTDYLHGAYGSIGDSHAANAQQTSTCSAYIGTAPVHLVRHWAEKNLVNTPLKVTGANSAYAQLGHAADWAKYTLCEATHLHFLSDSGAVGPFYAVNVLDPAVHKKDKQGTKQLTFVNGRVEFPSTDIILDSITIADKAEGVDFFVDYNYTTGTVILKALKEDLGTVSITYDEIDPSKVKATDIVGGRTAEGVYSGIEVLELLYAHDNVVPVCVAAPGWSHDVGVRNALVRKVQGIGSKMPTFAYTDIPTLDVEGGCDTIEKAKAYKETNDFSSQFEVTCWPMCIDNEGHTFHGSTLSCYTQQSVDADNRGIPFETASNKEITGVKQYFGASAKNAGYGELDANELNAVGIRTIIQRNGSLVLWGGHTAAYKYGVTSDPREIFDSNMRMLGYLVRLFIEDAQLEVDRPMTRQRKDALVAHFQNILDGLVADGALIGNPTFEFRGEENPQTNLVNGDFVFNLDATPTPQFKSATVGVHYSDKGFSVFYEAA